MLFLTLSLLVAAKDIRDCIDSDGREIPGCMHEDIRNDPCKLPGLDNQLECRNLRNRRGRRNTRVESVRWSVATGRDTKCDGTSDGKGCNLIPLRPLKGAEWSPYNVRGGKRRGVYCNTKPSASGRNHLDNAYLDPQRCGKSLKSASQCVRFHKGAHGDWTATQVYSGPGWCFGMNLAIGSECRFHNECGMGKICHENACASKSGHDEDGDYEYGDYEYGDYE
jgi:hypothetical protein